MMPRGLLRGFWKLTWLETKIFMREPMGFVGALLVPLLVFVVLGRAFGIGKPALRAGDVCGCGASAAVGEPTVVLG